MNRILRHALGWKGVLEMSGCVFESESVWVG